MKNLIESYNTRYKDYKKNIYGKLIFLIFLFGAPFIPTIIYYEGSLFVKILFWIFATILFVTIVVFIGLILFVSERPLYEFLYKDIIDLAFEEDFTHYEYESFPYESQFLEKGNLFFIDHSEVTRYQLRYYYLNNPIDLYSLYAYSKHIKSHEFAFNGIYFVLHCENQLEFEIRTTKPIEQREVALEKTILNDKTEVYTSNYSLIPENIKVIFNNLTKEYKVPIYLVGIDKEVHVAIDYFYDNLKPKELTEEKLDRIKEQFMALIQLGRKIYKNL